MGVVERRIDVTWSDVSTVLLQSNLTVIALLNNSGDYSSSIKADSMSSLARVSWKLHKTKSEAAITLRNHNGFKW